MSTRPGKDEVPSPCINVCSVDEDVGLCRGCYRSLDEVTHWTVMSNEQKKEVLETLPERKHTYAEILKP